MRPLLSSPTLLAAALLASACGGGSPSGPTPPAATYAVVAVAYYDANNNGVLDPGENNRVPGVTLEIGGRTGSTAAGTGQARVEGVTAGTYTVRATVLPAYYQPSAGSAPSVTVPQGAGAEVAVPLTLPLGANPPYTYMAFGDSITAGDGSSDGNGYRNRLRGKLQAHFGLSYVINEGVFGTQSDVGARRIGPVLDRNLPAYTLIMYGTNDWNDRVCRDEGPPCFTIDSLRNMVREAKSIHSLPVLSTIIPANEGINDRVPPERNAWVRDVNERIKALGREERVPVADPYRYFAQRTPLSSLFVDHVHPTDEGYEMIAQAFFEAISQPLP